MSAVERIRKSRAARLGVGFVLMLAGCDAAPNLERATTLPVTSASVNGAAAEVGGTLAYQHDVVVELSADLLEPRLRELETACRTHAGATCTIMNASLRSQYVPQASIRMRLARTGVDSMIERAAQGGSLISRSSKAEDLAQPIADTDRKLALLQMHRDRLAELLKSKDLSVEQLITLSKELATVQTEIDGLTANRGNLQQRIDTDLLTINLELPHADYAAERTPVTDAFVSFGSNFREALGHVITFLAMLIPWLVIIVPALIALRWLWRWTTRLIARWARTT